MWDRFDICVKVDGLTKNELIYDDVPDNSTSLTSDMMREAIEQARCIQEDRFKESAITYNSQMSSLDMEKYCKLGDEEKRYMSKVFVKMKLTARGYNKILKTARTIADLAGNRDISCEHLTEACLYRSNMR
jgi:magnesium chelatase family protein